MPDEGKNYEYDVYSSHWLAKRLVKHRALFRTRVPNTEDEKQCTYEDRTLAMEKNFKKMNLVAVLLDQLSECCTLMTMSPKISKQGSLSSECANHLGTSPPGQTGKERNVGAFTYAP